jgi:GH15 family glucan-1,4-alpha-glucosidase
METAYEQGLSHFVRERYTQEDIKTLKKYLSTQGTFDFEAYRSGLYPATPNKESEEGRYQYVWVRDNVYLANALLRSGRTNEALSTVHGLARYFDAHAERYDSVINGRVDMQNPMSRPHVRIDGETLEEVSEKWAHAQNDVHGLFLWITGTLVQEGLLTLDQKLLNTISRTIHFLTAIRFYEDPDSGVWEEARAVRASSIGAVCAGLLVWRDKIRDIDHTLSHSLEDSYRKGVHALNTILPFEVRSHDGEREYDASLVFLVEPLRVVSDEQANVIVERVRTNLMREKGISRYSKDAFWGLDYDRLSASLRTIDVSEDISTRREYAVLGKEAQWTVFDSLVALYFAKQYQKSGSPKDSEFSAIHLNRTLAMLVRTQEGKLLLPELYYHKDGELVPNTIVPLYWAQANLLLALSEMETID